MATGSDYADLYYTCRMGVSTISGIIKEVCTAIWEELQDECLPQPTTEKWLQIAAKFQQVTNFPNCISAIDGKHIRIINPHGGGSMFYNYKSFFSIVLLAMSDANYCFTYINVGSCGKNSDSSIFKESTLFRNLENGNMHIPAARPLPGTDIAVQHVIIGDGAFGISKHVLKPYSRINMTYKKKIYNYRLSRARRYIESTFGIMSNKFRIFHKPMNVGFNLAKDIVKACCILHNFIRIRDGYNEEDTLSIMGLEDMVINEPARGGNDLRDLYANYFISDAGRLPWQDNYIF